MSWEIKINWDECPYLEEEIVISNYKIPRELRCTKLRNNHCNKTNCPIKVD